MPKINKKKIILLTLVVFLTITITLGISYAFFRYLKKGNIVNTAITGNLSFSYIENECNGSSARLNLVDQFPISDSEGISQNECGEYFAFNINANTTSAPLDYKITATLIGDTTISANNIKLYLATVDDNQENQTESTYFNGQVALLGDFYTISDDNQSEKVIYQEKIAKGHQKYTKEFRLKVWLDENTIIYDNTDPNNIIDNRDNHFQIKVTVYAEAATNIVKGQATEWLGYPDYYSDGDFLITSHINEQLRQHQTSEALLKNFVIAAFGESETYRHYFKGKLRKEMDLYWEQINNETELTEEEIIAHMPLGYSLLDKDSTNDINVLDYVIKDLTKQEIGDHIVIPNVIVYPDGTTYEVKQVAPSLFPVLEFPSGNPINPEYNNITAITISEGIEELGEVNENPTFLDIFGPFSLLTNLTKVTLPSTLQEIGNGTFTGTSLTSIEIPYGVTKIGYNAFGSLENGINKVMIPSTVTYIGAHAFNESGLTKLIFQGHSALPEIYANTFCNNNLTSVFVPNTVVKIGRLAFANNDIASIVFEDTTIEPSYLNELVSYAFETNNLTSVTIPGSITKVGIGVFGNSPNLTKIIIKKADASGITLPDGWHSGAEVIFEP